jgi:hypothetical protein
MDEIANAPLPIEFGSFKVVPRSRKLVVAGRTIGLGSRAFDAEISSFQRWGNSASSPRRHGVDSRIPGSRFEPARNKSPGIWAD